MMLTFFSVSSVLTSMIAALGTACCTVFTAAQQKVAYEGLKLHVLLERPLCPECWTGHRALAKELRAIQCEWRQHSSQLKLDRVFLLRWQAVLNGLSKLVKMRF